MSPALLGCYLLISLYVKGSGREKTGKLYL